MEIEHEENKKIDDLDHHLCFLGGVLETVLPLEPEDFEKLQELEPL